MQTPSSKDCEDCKYCGRMEPKEGCTKDDVMPFQQTTGGETDVRRLRSKCEAEKDAWVVGKSSKDLEEEQMRDKDIARIITWKEKGTERPSWSVISADNCAVKATMGKATTRRRALSEMGVRGRHRPMATALIGNANFNMEISSGTHDGLKVQILQTTQSAATGDHNSDVFSSGSQDSVTAGETSQEWQPTSKIQDRLLFLNSFLRRTAGNISPIRSQLNTDVTEISTSTTRYYKRKATQAVETVLDAIAPANSTWLFQHVADKFKTTCGTDLLEGSLISKLIRLYEEADSWYTRQQILSIFVGDYSKIELLTLIPGLTKWRIDEARKHATETMPGYQIEPPKLQRSRLDPAKVDHFLDFISSPSFLQDVAYGTKLLKLSSGEKVEIPNVVRTVIASRLVQLYLSYCAEFGFQPIGRSTLFHILKVGVCTLSSTVEFRV
ncbi:hypothetical protein QZH41_008862 [Actinostola sp. cb2023]|nr:hypothetical protein QZH41_008862 [Actinostola sp. cb2023]